MSQEKAHDKIKRLVLNKLIKLLMLQQCTFACYNNGRYRGCGHGSGVCRDCHMINIVALYIRCTNVLRHDQDKLEGLKITLSSEENCHSIQVTG